ncbi:Ger(x)C family spore germination protein [Paenibacillus chondroitinus]|uniref:Ger(X)C family spore germination protein n=1 Tax=Paenibacillus chondroitinus TaxID=59842 RepID=A0ABU6D7H4_9BACL|nr:MULTISPECIES: Ger(x)C family spore germination protein [Paenibacillus]MCY9658101.1 Ger(x)C family spore germination protein [Paenibacillus anseongense]MEB4793237.1 Ger(x)C family spore germination protein [Paenibacillus chondroitinus]
MKMALKSTLIGCIILSLCGCWDGKNIQYFNFVNMIGIDYIDGKYKIYAQINNLASMAKQEGTGNTPNPIVVGVGKGESIGMAMFDLLKENQMRMDWTQTKVFIFSDRLLAKGIFNLHDDLMRTRDQRYTPWVFATNEDLRKILSTKPITGNSSINTVYYQPNLLYKQMQSSFEPVNYQRFIRASREPFETMLVDHIKLSESWDKEGKPFILPAVNGLVALKKGKSEARFNRKEASGVKWLKERTLRGILPMKDDQGIFVGTAVLKNNRIKKTTAYKNGKRFVKLDINMDASIREQKKPLGLNEMNMLIKKNVMDEITKTYEIGKKRAVDIYSLNEVWYRKGLTVNEDIPELELDVKVNLLAANMFELRD